MATPFLGEIRMFGGNYAPLGWAFCDGQLLSIGENSTLFNLIGTTYGGDGQQTFALPDLRGRVPIHFGSSYVQGNSGGAETVTLTSAHLPMHTHSLSATATANSNVPTGKTMAKCDGEAPYVAAGNTVAMQTAAIGAAGGGGVHDNLQPFLVISFIIALEGIFPSQN